MVFPRRDRPRDEIIGSLVDSGLAAIEAYHSSHDERQTAHYRALADSYELAVTGGSDYHGEGTRRAEWFGVVGLPQFEFEKFSALAPAAQIA